MTGNRHSGPLSDISVLDISEGIAGPFCSKLLADLGADVLKLEDPDQGDISRTFGPFPDGITEGDASGTYVYTNTSKRSVTVRLGTDAGRDLLFRLLATHDVVVASEPEGVLAARRFGYEDLRRVNPGAVLTTVTGFGSDGPYAGFAATHLIHCAMGAWANTCGLADREPLQAGGNLTDFIAGAYGAVATLAAVEQRAGDGLGQHVDVSAVEATITAALLPSLIYEYAGALPERNSARATGPSFMMECIDGYVGVNVLTQPQWEALCMFVGMPELIEEPAYRTSPERLLLAGELRHRIAPFFRHRSAANVFHDAQMWRLPFGLVPSLTDVLSLEQHAAREFFVRIPHPSRPGETVPTPGVPFRMPASPSAPGPSPRLGEHTDEVLTNLLGLSRDEVAQLRAEGVC